MAGTPAKAAGPKAGAETETEAGEPTVGNVPDTRDTSPRVKGKLDGKRLRAIPSVITKSTGHATTVEVRRSDFKSHDIDHPTVQFDFRKDNFTLKVGNKAGQISEEAADFLADNFPGQYEYIDQGDDESDE